MKLEYTRKNKRDQFSIMGKTEVIADSEAVTSGHKCNCRRDTCKLVRCDGFGVMSRNHRSSRNLYNLRYNNRKSQKRRVVDCSRVAHARF